MSHSVSRLLTSVSLYCTAVPDEQKLHAQHIIHFPRFDGLFRFHTIRNRLTERLCGILCCLVPSFLPSFCSALSLSPLSDCLAASPFCLSVLILLPLRAPTLRRPLFPPLSCTLSLRRPLLTPLRPPLPALHAPSPFGVPFFLFQIGRASCRERVF